jgi:hypothetical protein
MSKYLVSMMALGLWMGQSFASQSPSYTEAQTPRTLTFRNLMLDAPKVRVDGHVRGTEDALLTLTVLAPERVGLTTKEQPSLYWFQSKAVTNRFELIITEKNAIKPLLEAQIDAPSSGIKRVRLSDHNVRLAEGVEYRWSVAIVVDPENRSKDVVASGVIKRIKPAGKLLQRLRGAPESELPYIYADEGVWYDSLETLSELVEAKPQDAKLHEIRAVYFLQAGLHDAGLHDLKAAGRPAKSTTP